jgi:hypothetical protein
VCVWHHSRGIHAGVVRASGTAPGAVRCELGVRPGRPALLCWIGDTYVVPGDAGSSNRTDAADEGTEAVQPRGERDEREECEEQEKDEGQAAA